jgi:glucosamine--fructose-6-phosphate aminotransferase (isomerizing)
LTRYGSKIDYPPCLAIGVSQSGAAPDVSEVIGEMRRNGHPTLAVTNTLDSRLGREAEATILLEAGEERSVAATKTYTASLLALYQVVHAAGGELPAPVLPDERACEFCKEHAEKALGAVLRSDRWFALARGFSFASAQETALKMMECAMLPFKAYSSSDFQHGPRALATHGTMALVFGEPIEGLEESGCLVENAPKSGTEPYVPISEIMFAQWLALLAARARGLDPDRPQNLSKVTKTL